MPKLQNSDAKEMMHNPHGVNLFLPARLLFKKGFEAEMGEWAGQTQLVGWGRRGLHAQYFHPCSPA